MCGCFALFPVRGTETAVRSEEEVTICWLPDSSPPSVKIFFRPATELSFLNVSRKGRKGTLGSFKRQKQMMGELEENRTKPRRGACTWGYRGDNPEYGAWGVQWALS